MFVILKCVMQSQKIKRRLLQTRKAQIVVVKSYYDYYVFINILAS